MTGLKTLSQESLQSFITDVFSPSLLESARQTRGRARAYLFWPIFYSDVSAA